MRNLKLANKMIEKIKQLPAQDVSLTNNYMKHIFDLEKVLGVKPNYMFDRYMIRKNFLVNKK